MHCDISMAQRMNLKTVLIVLVALACPPSFSYANQPIDVLKESIERSISILKDPIYNHAGQKELQRQKLWEIMEQIFDFEEFSRRVLARNWRLFTPQQRAQFVELFGKFVDLYYLSRLQAKYDNETLNYVDQNLIGDSRAVVKVEVFWKFTNIPVEIKMLKRGDTWKVYDLSALGVSAISFYRIQFRAVMRKKSPEDVLALLRNKVKKAEEKVRRQYSRN